VGLVISLCFSYSYHKVKNTEDVKVLHKIVYFFCPNDSILEVKKQDAAKYFDNNDAASLRHELKKDAAFAKDSAKTEKRIVKKKQEKINAAKNSYIKKERDCFYKDLNVEEADCQVKIIVILLWIITALLLLIAFALRKRDFLTGLFKKQKDERYWFQKSPKLYMEEENEIRKRFRNAEKNVENGTVSFFIPTDKQIAYQTEKLSFQLVYSANYDKNREIKIYLVMPDLDELLGETQEFPYVAIDGTGEKYLDLNKTIHKDRVSGMEIIRKLYEWLQYYTRWRNREISRKDIKL
jgi:hypothetical protein